MRNAWGYVVAAFWLFLALVKAYETRVDWMAVCVCLGFSMLFVMLSLVLSYLTVLETKFDILTRTLSDTFVKLSQIEQKNYERFQGYQPTMKITFQGAPPSWAEESSMDAMSLEELEQERKKAEKEENYEKAAKIQKKIDQKKSGR